MTQYGLIIEGCGIIIRRAAGGYEIDFKAQNVIGANYSPPYWQFSPLFNGG